MLTRIDRELRNEENRVERGCASVRAPHRAADDRLDGRDGLPSIKGNGPEKRAVDCQRARSALVFRRTRTALASPICGAQGMSMVW